MITKYNCQNKKEKESQVENFKIFNQDMGLEFRIESCVLFIINQEKRERKDGIKVAV